MSIPINPLDRDRGSNYFNILVAFKHAEDAFDVKLTPDIGGIGDSIPNVGENIIIVNEASSNRFVIEHAIWDFNMTSPVNLITSSSVGKISISEHVPNSFLNFLKNNVLFEFNDGEDEADFVSISHLTFVLQTVFVLGESDENINGIEVYRCNPYYFHIDSITSIVNDIQADNLMNILHVIASSNTLGLLSSFSSLYQTTVTHKDGNIQNDTLISNSDSSGLKTRSEENRKFKPLRQNRINKSKPMLTLKDVMDGFESSLNGQKYIHSAQLQQWIRNIKSDSVDKIVLPPTQKKPPNDEYLPIDYRIDLDSNYHSYRIDNRNMPFEQPFVVQSQTGIRVLPFNAGTSIIDAIKQIMLLSRKVADDARLPEGEKQSFKVCITTIRQRSGNYLVNIKIRKTTLPRNTQEINTGPGNVEENGPLQFFINAPNGRSNDIIMIKTSTGYETTANVVEQISDNEGSGIIFGDREQATMQRGSSNPFFESLYNGVRYMEASKYIDGLENSKDYGDTIESLKRTNNIQQTSTEIVIRGNPHLLSDMNRTPRDIIEDQDGQVFLYIQPEINPVYVKLTIFEDNTNMGDNNVSGPNKLYYDNYYHVTRVINMFGVDEPRSFYQKLILKRVDSLMD